MRFSRSINANQLLGNGVVAMVTNIVGRGVAVIVTSLSVCAEAVGVLHPEVEAGVMADELRETDQRRGHVVELQPPVDVFV